MRTLFCLLLHILLLVGLNAVNTNAFSSSSSFSTTANIRRRPTIIEKYNTNNNNCIKQLQNQQRQIRKQQQQQQQPKLCMVQDNHQQQQQHNINKDNPRTRYNLNRRTKSPFGFDLNAEVWNGRVAQISFFWVLFQEAVVGKPILKSIGDGDASGIISLALFTACIVVLTSRFVAELPGTGLNKDPSPTNAVKNISNNLSIDSLLNPANIIQEESVWNKYNYNDGESPFGFRYNAEIWNGRVAQICFVWVFLQELVFNKPILKSINEGDITGVLSVMTFVGALTFLSSFIRYTEDNFVERTIFGGEMTLEANARIFETFKSVNVKYVAPTVNMMIQNNENTYVAPESSVPGLSSYEESFAANARSMTSSSSSSLEQQQWQQQQQQPSVSSLNEYYRTDTKIHPDIDFKFKSKTKKLFQKSNKKPAVVTSAAAYPVEGWSFKPDVKTLSKDAKIHPSGIFRFKDDEIFVPPVIAAAAAVAAATGGPPPQVYPVPAFNFKPQVKAMVQKDIDKIHPRGTFRFQDMTVTTAARDALAQGVTKVTSPKVLSPVAQVYPAPQFLFKNPVISKIHPDGIFRFMDSTKEAAGEQSIKTQGIVPLSQRQLPNTSKEPRMNAVRFPVPGFKFKETTQLANKETERTISQSPKSIMTATATATTTTTSATMDTESWVSSYNVPNEQLSSTSPVYNNNDSSSSNNNNWSYGNQIDNNVNYNDSTNAASTGWKSIPGGSGSYLDSLSSNSDFGPSS